MWQYIFRTTQSVRMFTLNLLVHEYFLVLCPPSPHHHHHRNFSNNPTLAVSLRSRRLEVVGTRKNGRARPLACLPRAPVLSFARYFQAPATQANWLLVIILFYLGIKFLTKSLTFMALAFF